MLGCPEFGNEVAVILIIHAEFSDLVVLELRVVLQLLRNALASEEPHSLDFEAGFFSEDSMGSEAVLSEVVESLQESIQQVRCLVENHTFTFVFLVVEEVDGVAFSVVLLQEGGHAFSLLVLAVHEEGLEVV